MSLPTEAGAEAIIVGLRDQVKPRIGVFYSTPPKDAEVDGMIAGAAELFKGGGWDIMANPSPLAIEALVLYCKMAQSTDPGALINHPVMISFIALGRSAPKEDAGNGD